MGNASSGRREAILSDVQLRALYRGLDLDTDHGLAQLLHRSERLMLVGKLAVARHKQLVASVRARAGIGTEARMDARIRELRKIRDDVMGAQRTASGTATRDVGPPQDALNTEAKT